MADNMNHQDKKKRVTLIIQLVVMILVGLVCYVKYKEAQNTDAVLFYDKLDTAEYKPYKEFKKQARAGEVDTLYYHTGKERMVYTVYTEASKNMTEEEKEGYTYPHTAYFVTDYPAGDDFRKDMLEFDLTLVLVRDDTTGATITAYLVAILPTVSMIAIFIWMTKRMMNSVSNIEAKEIIQKSNTKLDDIIGLDELRDEFKLIINIIKDPHYGEKIGVEMPNGILLSGAPGVGKTMIAKAISNEAGVPFLSVNGSDFVELYVGNGAKRVREVFRIARENAPCILFIDEFDAIGEKRDSVKSSSEDSRTINALLKEMDGFKGLGRVFVLAATNNPEKLDAAITRSGRFDREIKIMKPRDWTVRKQLFEHYLSDKAVGDDVDLDTLARTVAGFTGADISVVCNEAGLVALSHGLEFITHDSLVEAIDKKLLKGSRSKSKVNESDREIVAYHEAAHAVMSILTNTPVSRASIQSTTSGVGGVVLNEDSDSQFRTKDDLRNNVMVCFAGRISEEIKFNRVTTGASSDINQATHIMNEYINRYGFDAESGYIDIMVIGNGHGVYSTYTEKRIRAISTEIYEEATVLLKQHYQMVERLAQKLLEVDAMTGKEITEFFKEDEVEESNEELEA